MANFHVGISAIHIMQRLLQVYVQSKCTYVLAAK